MATADEVRDRMVERDAAERMGWSEEQVDAALPVLFTEREWAAMMADPVRFGLVPPRGDDWAPPDADYDY